MSYVLVPAKLRHLGKNKLLSSQVHSLLLNALSSQVHSLLHNSRKRICAKHNTQTEVVKHLLMGEDCIKILPTTQ